MDLTQKRGNMCAFLLSLFPERALKCAGCLTPFNGFQKKPIMANVILSLAVIQHNSCFFTTSRAVNLHTCAKNMLVAT